MTAAITVTLLVVLPVKIGVGFVAMVSVVAYAAYPVLALKRGEPRLLVGESALLLLGLVLVVLGVVRHRAWLAGALGIHALVDLAHERPDDRLVGQTPRWYTRFCLVYDWLVAVAIPFALR